MPSTATRRTGALRWTDRSLFTKMTALPPAVDAMVGQVMEYEANEAQNFMRTSARWTDRTGNARQGLFARAGKDDGSHFIVLYHTMPYGFWLEVKNGGRYAIIEPTLDTAGRQTMQSLQALFRALP